MTFSHSLVVPVAAVGMPKFDYSKSTPVSYYLIPQSKSMKSVIVACFRHNCCLSYARSLSRARYINVTDADGQLAIANVHSRNFRGEKLQPRIESTYLFFPEALLVVIA